MKVFNKNGSAYQVTETIPGTWSVHELNQPPVEGVAVWKYSWGWKCEECGSPKNTTKIDCWHISSVKEMVEEN